MKIRNLFLLTTITLLVSISAAGQERDGSVTFTDHLKQTITISRFGTVRTFTNGKGRRVVANHTFRVCPRYGKCTGSDKNSSGKSELSVTFPKERTSLKEGEALIVTANVTGPKLRVIRKMTFVAGSTSVDIEETVSSTQDTDIASLLESANGVLWTKPCPPPPPQATCPHGDSIKIKRGKLKMTKPFHITTAAPMGTTITCDFKLRQ